MEIRKLAYDLYKAEWLKRVTPEVHAETLKDYYRHHSGETDEYSFEEYVADNGYGNNGLLYDSFDRFIEKKYNHGSYIKSLLNDEDLFAEYLVDSGIIEDELENDVITVNALPTGSELIDFISDVSDMIDGENKTAVLDWIAFAKFMEDAVDINETTFEKELDEVYLPLCFVKNNFSREVLQKTVADVALGTEVIYRAALYSAGYYKEQIDELGSIGALLEGYIPLDKEEKTSLSLIGISNDPSRVFIATNIEKDVIIKCMKKAISFAVLQESDIESVLMNPATGGVPLREIANPLLVDALKIAVKSSTAFNSVTMLNPETNEVKPYEPENLTTEKIMGLFSDKSCGQTQQM